MQVGNAIQTHWIDEVKYWKSDHGGHFARHFSWFDGALKCNTLCLNERILHTSITLLTGTGLWIWTPRMTGGTVWSFKASFIFTSISAECGERSPSPDARDVSAHYLVPLRQRDTKVTASNLTCRDGNLSDTLNNLLMQKLKGLSVSLGGREESRVLDNGADVQDAGLCPSAEGRRTAEE